MANVAKGFAIGDTVWVYYRDSALQMTPQSRVVQDVKIDSSGNESTIAFTNGASVRDGAQQNVFTTQALCATEIISDLITRSAATVVLDATLSGASTAAQAAITLIRSDA